MDNKKWTILAGSGVLVVLMGLGLSLSTSLFGQKLSPAAKTVQANQSAPALSVNSVTVFRSPNCSCCGLWMEHLEAAGFVVQDTVTEDLAAVKQQHMIPDDLATCHTALVGNYLIEGHVPAADIQRLLAEQPDIAGLAVPGMPIGSPGMESGDYVEAYTVFAFAEDGSTTAFAQYP